MGEEAKILKQLVDIGQEYMMDHIQTFKAASLYGKVAS